MLTHDPSFPLFIMQRPSIPYKRCSSLKDTLTQSHLAKTTLNNCAALLHGTFKCGLFSQCPYIKTSKNAVLPNGKFFWPTHFVNSSTSCVVYIITCSYGGFYVGKTIRTLAKRVSEHVRDIKTGYLDRPLAPHATFHHGYKNINIEVRALDHVHLNVHGCDVHKTLLRIETRWIHDLWAVDLPGLNDYVSYKPFLESWSYYGDIRCLWVLSPSCIHAWLFP